jgi:uncharacterized membrane protein
VSTQFDSLPVASCAQPTSAALATAHARIRLDSIDVLRGLVIVLMALDHVRDYFTGVRFDPLDLSQAGTALFLTRWVTHFCAPIFILLAGVSAYLVSLRATRAELTRFLLTRGLWLILLEITIVSYAWTFDVRSGLYLQVIWAIGCSMVALAALIHMPLRVIGAISVAMIAGHNLLDGIAPEQFGAWAPVWNLLHVRGHLSGVYVSYPLIPWIGVMGLGYVLGSLYRRDPRERRAAFYLLGTLSLVAFLVVRLPNLYGDPHEWVTQNSRVDTLLEIVNVAKYPPSLQYLLITLGTAFLLLAAFERVRNRFTDVLNTFGRVPLFFYVLHIALAHLAAGLLALATGYGTAVLTASYKTLPEDWGYGLGGVYVAWILVLLALYPACRWFAAVKRRRTDWWLSYL